MVFGSRHAPHSIGAGDMVFGPEQYRARHMARKGKADIRRSRRRHKRKRTGWRRRGRKEGRKGGVAPLLESSDAGEKNIFHTLHTPFRHYTLYTLHTSQPTFSTPNTPHSTFALRAQHATLGLSPSFSSALHTLPLQASRSTVCIQTLHASKLYTSHPTLCTQPRQSRNPECPKQGPATQNINFPTTTKILFLRCTTRSAEFALPDSFQQNLCRGKKKTRNNTHIKHATAAPAKQNQRSNTFW